MERRRIQAQAVIVRLAPHHTLYLIGFSMGAQTVVDILPQYHNRVKGILLGCPAMYSPRAREIPFKNPAFTAILREDDSWKESTNPQALARYSGKVVVAYGAADAVIPRGVKSAYLRANKHSINIEYPGVAHNLAQWLSGRPSRLYALITQLIA